MLEGGHVKNLISECYQIICWSYKSRRRTISQLRSQIAKFIGPIWGPSGSCRPQMGPTLAPRTLLSGVWNVFPAIISTHYRSEYWVHCLRMNDRGINGYWILRNTWWRHQMETFSASLAICAGNSPVTGEFRVQRAVTRSFDAFFDLLPNKRLSKQSWGCWFETPSRPIWRHCNDLWILMQHSIPQQLFWLIILTESLVLLWPYHHEK